jgi:hypothetical protein
MEFLNQAKTGISIVTDYEIANVLKGQPVPTELAGIVTLSGLASASGTYTLYVVLSDVRVYPSLSAVKPSNVTSLKFNIARVIVDPNERIKLFAVGQGADTSVDSLVKLYDVNSDRTGVLGYGTEYVDHNYGGADNLSYLDGSIGVNDGKVRVYTKASWDLNRRSRDYVLAEVTTDYDGRWSNAVLLNPGEYVLLYHKTGAYHPSTRELVVL